MGGSNETKLGNLRAHISLGKVHLHDDALIIKFVKDETAFKKEISAILNKKNITEGTHIISGDTEVDLYLIVKDNNVSCCLKGPSVLKEFSSFVKGN